MGCRAHFGASALWKTLNATKRTLQAALWDAARTRLLTPTYALNRARAHSLTHTLILQSITPIHFCTLYEKIIFTCGVIRSFNFVLRYVKRSSTVAKGVAYTN